MASTPCAVNDHRAVVDYLEHIYKNVGSGFGNDHPSGNCDSSNLQYGEVTYDGMGSVYDSFGLKPTDTFYDLGSGTAKLVLYVALRGKGTRSIGLEFGERRHALAETACKNLTAMLEKGGTTAFPALDAPCADFQVQLADITKQRYADANVVMMSNVCMDMNTQLRALDCLLKSPSMKRLVCITAMPPNARLKLVKTVRVACTWAKISSWHVYDVLPPTTSEDRRLERAKVALERRQRTTSQGVVGRSSSMPARSSTPTRSGSIPKTAVLELLVGGKAGGDSQRVSPVSNSDKAEPSSGTTSADRPPRMRRSNSNRSASLVSNVCADRKSSKGARRVAPLPCILVGA